MILDVLKSSSFIFLFFVGFISSRIQESSGKVPRNFRNLQIEKNMDLSKNLDFPKI